MSFGTIDNFSYQQNKELRSWYWYDWANQSFALTVSTILAPALIARYYDRAIKITDVKELGDVMIDQLSGLFENKKLH